MPDFTASDGTRIAFLLEGAGPPVVLLHGAGTSGWLNWVATGWTAALGAAGWQAVVPDARGHGQSDKPEMVEAYLPGRITGDVVELMDLLGLDRAHVHGYSMGGATALRLAIDHPDRLISVVVGGIGPGPRNDAEREELRRRITAEGGIDLMTPREKELFGETMAQAMSLPREGGAFGAMVQAVAGAELVYPRLHEIGVPLLAVHGAEDPIVNNAEAFATEVPGGRHVAIPEMGHVTTIMSEEYQKVVLAFLAEHR